MTAVLQPVDVFRSDRLMAHNDEDFSDWKSKYYEVADMLQETRQELDDFQVSSRELEEELEKELARTEKAQQDLKVKAARAEHERDEWKSKFVTLQTTHNTTTTSLQRELDTLRKDYQDIKVQFRELEMGNDDLERSERAISSSLADVEQKYSRVLEEKILLEHELLDKAHLEEEFQRLKDDLRDANEEISILKEQLSAALDRAPVEIPPSGAPSRASQISDTDEDYAHTSAPSDLKLSELIVTPATPTSKGLPALNLRTTETNVSSSGHAAVLHRAGFHPRATHASPSLSSNVPSSLTRSNTTPLFTPTRTTAPRNAITKPLTSRNISNLSTSSTGTVAASKGVQMLSEMRARVEVLGQKIHTRVPRIRMGSVSNRPVTITPVAPAPPPPPPKAGPSSVRSPSTSTSSTKSSLRSRSPEKTATIKSKRQSVDFDDKTRTPVGNSSGWVLIMEDSPSPAREKEQRRRSGAAAPSAFRPLSQTFTSSAQSPTDSRPPSSLAHSSIPTGIRRPQSRTSEGRSSISTNATTSTASSIATPVSRPTTPTFLPVPTAGLYHSTTAQKRSSGPMSGAYSQPKRSSLGASTNLPVRQSNKTGSPALAQSRIGRPTPPSSPGKLRTNNADFADAQFKHGRNRAGSAALLLGSLRLQQD
ncbi:hypothetical protein BC835DRAFT_1315347 [Cytidiella melzeri]|nr:hypothetical protein BC835DRAFT_1315347 [Cytidiella melzeri]